MIWDSQIYALDQTIVSQKNARVERRYFVFGNVASSRESRGWHS
jgi:hypothetical protein